MAGNYPDVPSWRMAYDVDGTQVYDARANGTVTQIASGTVANMNSERNTGLFNNNPTGEGQAYYTFIFPELRDLDGFLLGQSTDRGDRTVRVSSDTTNGIDGTWTTLGTTQVGAITKEAYRNSIAATTALGIKAIKIPYSYVAVAGGQNSFYVIHLYGEPSPGENLQRLEIWHPTLDQRLGPADFDWGDVPRNSTETREFRIKNMHPTLTANGVRAAMSILTDTTPSVIGQQSISKDGGSTWGAQQTLDNPLGPEEISPVLQLRRQTPNNATLSLWWYRVFADATSWT